MRESVDKRHDQVDAGAHHRAQPTKAFDHMLLGLRYDFDRFVHHNNQKGREQDEGYSVQPQFTQEIFKGHQGPLVLLKSCKSMQKIWAGRRVFASSHAPE